MKRVGSGLGSNYWLTELSRFRGFLRIADVLEFGAAFLDWVLLLFCGSQPVYFSSPRIAQT